jgi:hypothetical protein
VDGRQASGPGGLPKDGDCRSVNDQSQHRLLAGRIKIDIYEGSVHVTREMIEVGYDRFSEYEYNSHSSILKEALASSFRAMYAERERQARVCAKLEP